MLIQKSFNNKANAIVGGVTVQSVSGSQVGTGPNSYSQCYSSCITTCPDC